MFNFLSNYMEILIAAQMVFLLVLIAALLHVRVKNTSIKVVRQGINRFLYFFVVVSEGLLIVIILSLYQVNAQKSKPLDFDARIDASTDWVKQDLQIYFISKNKLISIGLNGKGRNVLMDLPEAIRSYHFSPDGRYLIVLTNYQIYLFDQKHKKLRLIDQIETLDQVDRADTKGVVDGVAWGPKSKKFCYRLALWTKFSSHEQWRVYDVDTEERGQIKNRNFSLASLQWSVDSKSLYDFHTVHLNFEKLSVPYEVRIYRISLEDLTPSLLVKEMSYQPELSKERLAHHGIYLFRDPRHLSFGRDRDNALTDRAANGARIGISRDDRLFYIRNRWWKKWLYQIPRIGKETYFPNSVGREGELAVQYLQWLPGGRYVIMEHYYFGILILEPASGKIGLLVNELGNTFGWPPNTRKF